MNIKLNCIYTNSNQKPAKQIIVAKDGHFIDSLEIQEPLSGYSPVSEAGFMPDAWTNCNTFEYINFYSFGLFKLAVIWNKQNSKKIIHCFRDT